MPEPMIDPNEDVWAVPPTAVSWDVQPPFTVSGLILKSENAQQTDFETKRPLFWDDGRPRKKVIVTLGGKPNPEEEGDDGLRAIHARIPSALFTAMRDAVKEAGLKTLPTGGTHWMDVTYTQDGEQTKQEIRAKRSPPKEFIALITEAADSDTGGEDSEPPF
jgi:hypothetical protein